MAGFWCCNSELDKVVISWVLRFELVKRILNARFVPRWPNAVEGTLKCNNQLTVIQSRLKVSMNWRCSARLWGWQGQWPTPSTGLRHPSFNTAISSYTIGSRKLSANEQFFVGAQTVVSLLQTTQIKQGVPFIAANKVYTSANKTTIVSIETELLIFFYPGWTASQVYVRGFGVRLLIQSY